VKGVKPRSGHDACVRLGLEPVANIYNTFANFVVSMSPLEMARCKKARLLVNQTKVIRLFRKPEAGAGAQAGERAVGREGVPAAGHGLATGTA
jgi:hypothetical protein